MTNLSHLNQGDKFAIKRYGRVQSYAPQIDYTIFTVERKTATQLVSSSTSTGMKREVRVRIKDCAVIGTSYHAIEATPEVISEHIAQTEEFHRYKVVLNELSGLIGKELYQLKLSTAQLEHLAKAWKEVHAMKEIT